MTQYFFRKLDPSENDSVAKFFDIRSNGIKDLSFGYMADEDWKNPDDGNKTDIEKTKVPPIKGIDYYLIASIITEDEHSNKLFTFFGDGLVEEESALSDTFRNHSTNDNHIEMKLFKDLNHLTLLEAEDVFRFINERL